MSGEAPLSWFCIYAPAREFSVEAEIAQLASRFGRPLDAYCPAVTRWHSTAPGVRHKVQEPLYSGYLFVGMAPDARGDYPFPAIKAIEGVVDFLGASGAPAEIPYAFPDPEYTRLLREPQDGFTCVFGLRLLEHARAFDFTRNGRRAAKAVRRARLTFRSFADLGQFLDGRAA